jgi:hypothetical protein
MILVTPGTTNMLDTRPYHHEAPRVVVGVLADLVGLHAAPDLLLSLRAGPSLLVSAWFAWCLVCESCYL